ncbi:solute carrier family 22 member 7 [Dermacentor silvarum]|uniref:solute carrier family 22 member 7 n=1 Tax=Dermacentor silvarum TaxID=543639 RepID=UPI001898955B|nr:solute carrier family 22 member 7 [Dermacentor silvarum]
MDLFLPRRLAAADLLTSECFDCQEGFGDGVFQRRLLILTAVTIFLLNGNAVLLPLISHDVDHWCKRPAAYNVSVDAWKNDAIPVGADGRHSRCHVFENPGDSPNDTSNVVECYEWDYDQAQASTSVISVWNMVCHRRALLAAAMAAQHAGSGVFLLLSGAAADLFGRMPVQLVVATATIASTVAGCLAPNYALYTLAQFFVSGCVAASSAMTVLVCFEVTVHEHRPLYLIFAATASFVLGDLWFVIITSLQISWALKQAVFLSPTLLLLATFGAAQESPRWLIAKGNLKEAKATMLIAAEMNRFSFAGTACLLDKLMLKRDRWKYRNCAAYSTVKQGPLLDAASVRRRALIMFAVQFSLMFAVFTDVISMVARSDDSEGSSGWFMGAAFVGSLLSYAAMHTAVTRFALVKVFSVASLVAGCTHCLLTFVVSFHPAATVLLALSRGILVVAIVVSVAYIMETVPTAVRGVALCWALASGSIGALCASSTLVLQQLGREDVAFAMAALLLLVSLFVISDLPASSAVECKVTDAATRRQPSISSKVSIDHMKKTLEQCPLEKYSSMVSKSTTRSKRSMSDGSLRLSSSHSIPHQF